MNGNEKWDAAPGKALEWRRAAALILAAVFLAMAFAVQGPVTAHAGTKKATPSVSLSKTSFTYNGKTQKPGVTVKVGGKKLSSKYYTVTFPKKSVNAGTYKVKVSLKNGYSGSKTASYKIKPLKADDAYAIFENAELKYTGKYQRPKLQIIIAHFPSTGSQRMSKSDYSVDIPKGKKMGTYKFKIKLKGNYTGTFVDAYEIKKESGGEPRASW